MNNKPLLMSKDDFRVRFDEIHAEHEALKQKYADNPGRG
jgi:hypothetical protein